MDASPVPLAARGCPSDGTFRCRDCNRLPRARQPVATREQRTRSRVLELARLRLRPRRPGTRLRLRLPVLAPKRAFAAPVPAARKKRSAAFTLPICMVGALLVHDLQLRHLHRNDQLVHPLPPPVQGDDSGFHFAAGTGGVRFRSGARPPSTKFRRTSVFIRHENASPGRPVGVSLQQGRDEPSRGRRLRIVSWRISRSSAVSRTSCALERLSVPRHSMDGIPYRSFYYDNALARISHQKGWGIRSICSQYITQSAKENSMTTGVLNLSFKPKAVGDFKGGRLRAACRCCAKPTGRRA